MGVAKTVTAPLEQLGRDTGVVMQVTTHQGKQEVTEELPQKSQAWFW